MTLTDDHVGHADLSIVIPVYNEQDNIQRLHELVRLAVDRQGYRCELIFVDDGSDDETLNRLKQIQNGDRDLRIIQFRRNFGQTAAMRAGFQHARAPIIVTMDGDLQNDPDDIPTLIDKLNEGFDLVIGWRRDRQDAFLSRVLPSKVANWWISRLTGVKVHDSGCSLKAYRSEMIKKVPLYSEMHRFIPALTAISGARVAEVVVRHHPRRHGDSKYGLSRIGVVLLDVLAIKMLVSFVRRPMHWFFALSIPFSGLSILTAGAYFILWTFGKHYSSSVVFATALMLFMYLTVHFLFLGLLAELVVKTRLHTTRGFAARVQYFRNR